VWFSLIVPVWNRQDTLARCLDSCLTQDFADWEVLAVDDGSRDRSLEILRSYQDPRIRVVALSENRGVSAARNAGAAQARGRWLVYLDSDDALLPGGLGQCHEVTRQSPPTVGVVALAYRKADGGLSPQPLPPEGVLDFPAYLRWVQHAVSTDYLPLHRRQCWQQFPWPETRALQRLTTMRILSHWDLEFSPRVAAAVYVDTVNRYTTRQLPTSQWEALLEDQLGVLREFGPALRREVPRYYAVQVRTACAMCFLAGRRGQGLGMNLRYLARRPWSLKGWAMLLSGMIGPGVFHRLRAAADRLKGRGRQH
jgi:glycosyltransferase involved in cell wall biosynthesis